MNIAFHYLYRDGANYKNFGTVIFKNDGAVTLETFQFILKNKLISEEYFYVDQLQLPDLHFGTWDEEFDHDFHSFEAIEYSNDPINIDLTLNQFIELLYKADWNK